MTSFIWPQMCVCEHTYIRSLTLSSPRPSKARSLPTCYVAPARAQLVPIYSCTYYNVDALHSGLGCVEMFDEQSSVWCCHLWTFFCTISKNKEPFTIMCLQHDLWFTVTLSAVLAVGV